MSNAQKVLKEAFFLLLLLLLFFLAWNLVQKMFLGTKNVRGNRKCSWEQKMFVGTKNVRGNKKCSCYGIMWPRMALSGLISFRTKKSTLLDAQLT